LGGIYDEKKMDYVHCGEKTTCHRKDTERDRSKKGGTRNQAIREESGLKKKEAKEQKEGEKKRERTGLEEGRKGKKRPMSGSDRSEGKKKKK